MKVKQNTNEFLCIYLIWPLVIFVLWVGLSKELLTFVDEAGLDRMKWHSQCYDGAGKVKGLGPRIQKQLPKALPFWCTAYQLNRCIIQACNIPSVRNNHDVHSGSGCEVL
jgi:hypothetical protein